MVPQKKLKSKFKRSQVTSTIERCIINTRKGALSFKFMKTQVMSGSQDQKEKKAVSTLTIIFFSDKKITTAQICFSNNR